MSADKDSTLLFDAPGFEKDIKAAKDASKPTEAEEAAHLAKIELWTTALGIVGLLLAIRGTISPLAMILLGFYKYGKFAILAHHSLHGGWGLQRRGWFARGPYRRVIDWLDWILPAAWINEHNKVHHYYLNEDIDPDFVERNTEVVQQYTVGLPLKYALVVFQASIWKWWYYASNTLKTLHDEAPGAPSKEELEEVVTMTGLLWRAAIPGNTWHRGLAIDFLFRVMAPPFFLTFILIPVVAGLLNGTGTMLPFCWLAFFNIVGAELVTNLHAFVTIVTNHAGSDLWAFKGTCKADTAEFFVRSVLASTAYHAGNDLIDYYHGYLNYQGEHHAFPALSPLHYQRLHPLFKAVCAKYGVPYIQEPVWVRTKKTADVIVGVAKHKRMVGNAIDQPELWMCKKSES